MHKITKGLKKKKKGKKSKHKEEELFKPEELEAYRKEHQQIAPNEDETNAPPINSDEWKKFNALTAGIDSVLKKTQDDLDRIKSTSFFQRVPTASEKVKRQQEAAEEAKVELARESTQLPTSTETAIVPVSESESEEEDDEDIFDTSYIDAIAAGEVKLAYIPESPTEEEGSDPFDTSIAERAILGPAVTRKGKKLVPIGAAVEVLTGRVQAPTCVPINRPSTRRKVLKERDLLLGSFDDNTNGATEVVTNVEFKPSLLDDEAPLSDQPIDLTKSYPIPVPKEGPIRSIAEEFDVIKVSEPEDDDDKEFSLLAAESLSKKPIDITPVVNTTAINESWNAFDDKKEAANDELEISEGDPFDTTFAENILPGKAELKLIENEILDNDFDFDPRAVDKISAILGNPISIQVIDPTGQRESVSSSDKISELELNTIRPIHRDLLGGSNTDLSNLGDQPLKPKEQVDDNYIEYCDPFDTSVVDTATAPGQTELKFLEKELLSDITRKDSFSDNDFDPRGEEQGLKTISRPDNLTITTKIVSFDLPSPEKDLLAAENEGSSKVSKPLTPYYVRKTSIIDPILDEELSDPFDTSFVSDTAPGKAELKLIEKELFPIEISHSISDQDFNPRDESRVTVKFNPVVQVKAIPDLLSIDNEVTTKVLTPAAEKSIDFPEIFYSDPFDTSIANNILPGKAELKLLETELIRTVDLNDPDFNPRESPEKTITKDFLTHPTDIVPVKPLSPLVGEQSIDIPDYSDIDPFDTSIANNIGPGKTELLLLESELI